MKEIEVGVTYSHSDGRLVSSENHVSFVVPEGVYGEDDGGMFLLRCDDLEKFDGTLYLHNKDDALLANWIDESWDAGGERLERGTDIDPVGGHPVLRFKSDNYVGFKINANDTFGNGFSGRFEARKSAGDGLLKVLKELIDSVQFVHTPPSDQEQKNKARVNKEPAKAPPSNNTPPKVNLDPRLFGTWRHTENYSTGAFFETYRTFRVDGRFVERGRGVSNVTQYDMNGDWAGVISADTGISPEDRGRWQTSKGCIQLDWDNNSYAIYDYEASGRSLLLISSKGTKELWKK